MHLLKQDTPFLWDETTQQSFEALNKALISSPLFYYLDYTIYFILYLATCESTIGVVLVQEDNEFHEHVVYYLVVL